MRTRCRPVVLLLVTLVLLAARRPGGCAVSLEEILEGVRLEDRRTLREAEERLAGLGGEALPALEAALENASGARRCVLEGAVFRLRHRVDPPARIREWIGQVDRRWARRATPDPLCDPAVGEAFPGRRFYSVVFPPWPVARALPPPLRVANLFAVDRGGNLVHLEGPEALETFFREHAREGRSEEAVRRLAAAWLSLTAVFSQDGHFRFRIPEGSLEVARAGRGWDVRGVAEVIPRAGDHGAIRVRLRFGPCGRLRQVAEERTVRPGVRPICQATLLLHPDPRVRRMAERDLEVMGPAALPYLEEQRARASSPELREAIEAVLERIRSRTREGAEYAPPASSPETVRREGE